VAWRDVKTDRPRSVVSFWLSVMPVVDPDARAYEQYPDKWTRIASIVDRTEKDCRDRWKHELRDKDSRQSGGWRVPSTFFNSFPITFLGPWAAC
jgi:hypothetical protein